MVDKKNQTLRLGFLLFWIFFKNMLFAFTGGGAILSLLRHDIVDKHHLMSEDNYLEIIALMQTLPGVISLHNANLTGHKVCGWFGSLMACAGTIIPAFFSMLFVAICFQQLAHNKIVAGAVRGIQVVSVALLVDTGIRIIQRLQKNVFRVILVLVAFCVPYFTSLSSFWSIMLCGLCGVAVIYLKPAIADDSVNTLNREADE